MKRVESFLFSQEKIFSIKLGKCCRALLCSGSFSIESTMSTAGKSDEKRCNNVDENGLTTHALHFIHKFNSCFRRTEEEKKLPKAP